MVTGIDVPGLPPVAVHGDQVTFTGGATVALHQLVQLAVASLEAQAMKTGVAVPPRLLLVAAAAEKAALAVGADMRTSTDVRSEPTSASSVSGCWVGVPEAAGLLGVGERQARRRIQEAGGHKTRNGWRVLKSELLADIELRRTA